MRRAIQLSKRGYPAPNPRVGCVIVAQGEIVGEGFHEFAGGPHAEVAALNQAGGRAKGGHAFVTLEPCNHQGRTGPCSRALLEAGVKEVTFAVADPNPQALGGGETLAKAGVRVTRGLLESEARSANRRWLRAMDIKRPYVALKVAVTIDGRIALATGESKWITDERARLAARKLRAELGAVLVGSRTIERDDPKLDVRGIRARNAPLKVVLDPNAVLKGDETVFRSGDSIRFVAKGKQAHTFDRELPLANSQFDLNKVLAALWQMGCTGVLVEGGAATLSAFVQARIADEIHVFWGPKLFGNGPAWFENTAIQHITDAIELNLCEVKKAGAGIHARFEPDWHAMA